jgi:RNA polymerase sigma-70 factor (ECF subfamily)
MTDAAAYSSATTTQLLDSLQDESNQEVWVGFDARYRPIVEGVARRLGLACEDAADVAQETLAVFVRDYRRGLYERGKGRLRAWILTIARNRAIDLLRSRDKLSPAAGDSVLLDLPSEADTLSAWQLEEERVILDGAYHELCRTTRSEPTNLRVFELTALQGLSSEAAAAEMGLTVEQVRLAKHRVMNRLRSIVERLTDAYHTDQ